MRLDLVVLTLLTMYVDNIRVDYIIYFLRLKYIFIGDKSECHEKENKNGSCGLKRKVHVDKNLLCLMNEWRP